MEDLKELYKHKQLVYTPEMTPEEIYKYAETITEEKYTELFSALSDKDKETVRILIRLGDSKELAIATLIGFKKPDEESETYKLLIE